MAFTGWEWGCTMRYSPQKSSCVNSRFFVFLVVFVYAGLHPYSAMVLPGVLKKNSSIEEFSRSALGVHSTTMAAFSAT